VREARMLRMIASYAETMAGGAQRMLQRETVAVER
jgi:hypothetical protein